MAADLTGSLTQTMAEPSAAAHCSDPCTRIEAPLGQGGMGQVFSAIDTRLGRRSPSAFHEQFSDRFGREASDLFLNHPHICTLYDVGPNSS